MRKILSVVVVVVILLGIIQTAHAAGLADTTFSLAQATPLRIIVTIVGVLFFALAVAVICWWWKLMGRTNNDAGPIFLAPAMIIVIVLFGLALLWAPPVHAANPADLTSFYRQIDSEYYMVSPIDTDKSRWAFVSFPLGEKRDKNTYLFVWEDEPGTEHDLMIAFSKKFRHFDATIDATLIEFKGAPFSLDQEVGLDFPLGKGGIGTVLPLATGEDPEIGARYDLLKQLRVFGSATIAHDRNPLWGVTFRRGTWKVEAAHEEDAHADYAKISYSKKVAGGWFIPELRLESNDDDPFVAGFSLSYMPD